MLRIDCNTVEERLRVTLTLQYALKCIGTGLSVGV